MKEINGSRFLEELRNRTRFYHEALEQNQYAKAILSSSVSIEDYSIYLQKFYGFLQPFEAVVFEDLDAVIPDIEGRRKTEHLKTDLRKLGIDCNEVEVIDTALIDRLYKNQYQRLGGLYVMEGSALGGTVISKHLYKTLGEKIEGRSSFFNCYGKEAGKLWKQFLDYMLHEASTDEEKEEMITGAVATFKAMNNWMHDRLIEERIPVNSYNNKQ